MAKHAIEPKTSLSPMAIPVVGLAKMLSAAGGQAVTVEMIEADIAAGAPTNDGGTVNLVYYAAWLAKEMSSRADGSS